MTPPQRWKNNLTTAPIHVFFLCNLQENGMIIIHLIWSDCDLFIFLCQMFTGLLKHMPPPASTAKASSSATEQNSNAQTTVPTIPRGHLVVGPNDQLHLLTPVGSTATSNHYTIAGAHATKQPGGALQPNEEDDRGGRVKKKRKKKDKREWDREENESEGRVSSKPKKRKEEREALVVTLRRNKEPKEGKGRREPRSRGQEGRKGNEIQLKNVPGGRGAGAAVAPQPAQVPVKVPGKRGRKPKVKVLPSVSTNEGRVLWSRV